MRGRRKAEGERDRLPTAGGEALRACSRLLPQWHRAEIGRVPETWRIND